MTLILRTFHSLDSGEDGSLKSEKDIPYRAKLCRAKLFVGRNFRHQTENSSLSPDEKFRPIKTEVPLNEVQVNLRGKQVI